MIDAGQAAVTVAAVSAVPVEPAAHAHRNALLAWTVVAGLAALVALTGCGHAHGVEHPPAAGTEGNAQAQGSHGSQGSNAPNAPNSKPPADHPEHVARPSETQSDVAARSGANADVKDVPLSTSRAGLLEPGAAKKIQERLVALGFLDESKKSGALDEPTAAALRRFQKSRDMVVTGAPDQETVKKLDLDPKDMFKAAGSDR